VLGTIVKRTGLKSIGLPSSSVVADVVSDLNAKLGQNVPLLEVLGAIDAARDPLCEQFNSLLNSRAAAQALTLKILNLLVAKYHFQARNEVLLSRPFGLVVDPANGCNLACPGCVHSEHSKTLKLFDWDKGMLSEERFQALLHQYGAFAVQIMFCNYGEPTANLKTPRFIKLAKSYLIQTALSTNLTIPRFDADAYAASGLDFMYLSIDGATQGVYGQFRKKGHIDLVFENIRKLVDAKKRLGKGTPILRWQYLASAGADWSTCRLVVGPVANRPPIGNRPHTPTARFRSLVRNGEPAESELSANDPRLPDHVSLRRPVRALGHAALHRPVQGGCGRPED